MRAGGIPATSKGLVELHAAFFDPASVRQVRRALELADPAGPPLASFLYPDAASSPVTRLGVLSGSFNPLTGAHVAVAARAHAAFRLDLVAFALSTHTVDKERVAGMLLEDRLLTLELYARRHAGCSVLVANRGLYVEQAEVLHASLPTLRELYFVVGFDKIVQVFDPRYYPDRDAALDRLFALASLVVVPRGSQGKAELAALLSRAENRPYADRVFYLPLPERYRDLSSTGVREALEQGRRMVTGLPPETRACIQATRVYRSRDASPPYTLRPAVLKQLAGQVGD